MIQAGDALLVVDVQNDFLPGGPLAVPHGEAVIPILNEVLTAFAACGLPVFASRDWHPASHCSFRNRGGPWPPHCIAETPGAAFPTALSLPDGVAIVSKAMDPETEAYSAFAGTGLAARLAAASVRRLFVGGLATDYCVLSTVRDARHAGFEVVVLMDGIRAVDAEPGDGLRALDAMAGLGAALVTWRPLAPAAATAADTSVLLTDLYELTMLQAYADCGMAATAVFEFFVRRLPPDRNFLLAAGLEQVLEFLVGARFTAADLAWLGASGRFRADFVARLAEWRFTGDVDALPEGTVCFADEPLLRVTAPLAQAQLIETRIINLLQFQTLVASKAVRAVLAAPDRLLVDFGLRRAHGAEAGLLSARASYLAGFGGTSNVLAGRRFGIPLYGTMAHAYVQAHRLEEEAFAHFARSHPGANTMLIDTYDTEAAAAKLGPLATRLAAEGIGLQAVRIDSGDLGEHARRVRRILDEAGLAAVSIFASGNLDEHKVATLRREAPIDAFGIGTRMNTSADAPYLDCAYKLEEYDGRPCRKRSEGKATWPGRKQVFRRYDAAGLLVGDVLALADEQVPGRPLLVPVMRRGQRLLPAPTLADIRVHAAAEIARLPATLRSLERRPPLQPDVSPALRALAARVDAEIGRDGGRH